jgi:hypothetical protein
MKTTTVTDKFNLTKICEYIVEIFLLCSYYFIEWPILKLYLLGPAFMGFWEGNSAETICAALTNVPEEHWRLYPEICAELLERKSFSYVVILYCAFYFYLLLKLVCMFTKKLFSVWFYKNNERRSPVLWENCPEMHQKIE